MKNKISFALITALSVFSFSFIGVSSASAATAVFRILPDTENETIKASSAQGLGSTETKFALYTITYSLRAFGGDMFVPAVTARETGTTKTFSGGAGYKILGSDLLPYGKGTTGALLLSTSTLDASGMYKIPDGERREFTLIVLLDNSGGENDDYRLALTRTAFKTSATSTKTESDDVSARKYWTKETFLISK